MRTSTVPAATSCRPRWSRSQITARDGKAQQERSHDRPPETQPTRHDRHQAHTEDDVPHAPVEEHQEDDLRRREDGEGDEGVRLPRAGREKRDRDDERDRPVNDESHDARPEARDRTRPDGWKAESSPRPIRPGILARSARRAHAQSLSGHAQSAHVTCRKQLRYWREIPHP